MKGRFIFAAILFFFWLALISFQVTYSFFSDSGQSSSNVFTAAAEFPITSPITSAALKINEFFPSPSGEESEWVEIFNGASNSVDLTGWKITDGNAINDDLVLSGTIGPNGFMSFDHASGWLNSNGDTVNLVDSAAQTVDSETYTGGLEDTDKSIGRDSDGTGLFKQCSVTTKGLSNNGQC